MKLFSAKILKLGVNPYVGVPDGILRDVFRQAGKTKGPIPVEGSLNEKKFKQTIVKYQGAWRLYLNTPMRKATGLNVGDQARIGIEFDHEPRIVPMHPGLKRAFGKAKRAKSAFEKLTPSRRKEILRYLNSLKTAETAERNIGNVIRQLTGRKTKKLSFLGHR